MGGTDKWGQQWLVSLTTALDNCSMAPMLSGLCCGGGRWDGQERLCEEVEVGCFDNM